MKLQRVAGVSVIALAVVCGVAPGAHAGMTKCTLKFNLSGWSVFYKTAHGTGTVTCDNGQTAHVRIKTKGGGLTIGKSDVVNGKGSFSDVANISEVFGTYASAEASAGAVKSADSQVVTKGSVSLALSGTGRGWDLGISFGKFVIQRHK
jgi:hypothetical protein